MGRCTDFLVFCLDMDNCIELLEFSKQIGCEKLRLVTEKFAGEHFHEVYFKCILDFKIIIISHLSFLGHPGRAGKVTLQKDSEISPWRICLNG